jgi:hypothetical protein
MQSSFDSVQSSAGEFDLYCGGILSPKELGAICGNPPQFDIPVVEVNCDVGSELPTRSTGHVGYGAIPFDGGVYLTVRLQVGSRQVICLANPADPHIERLMSEWDREKTMGVTAIGHEGKGPLIYSHFELHPQARALIDQSKRDPHYLARFQRALTNDLYSRNFQMSATSDIPGIRTLSDVRVALLATEVTTPGEAFAVPTPN